MGISGVKKRGILHSGDVHRARVALPGAPASARRRRGPRARLRARCALLDDAGGAVRSGPPRDFMSRLLDRTLGPGNSHPIEYQLFFTAIRQNAAERLRAW